eukprot:63024-Amphidinium_carterae.1
MQANAHRAQGERCQLCDGPAGIEHVLWHCEARTLKLVLDEPARAAQWPDHFRQFALVSDLDEMDVADVAAGREYMTRTLIARRLLQAPLDQACKAAKRKRKQRDISQHDSEPSDGGVHPESRLTSAWETNVMNDMGAPVDPTSDSGQRASVVHHVAETHRPGESAGSSSVLLRPEDDLHAQPPLPNRAAQAGLAAPSQVVEILDTDDDETAALRAPRDSVDGDDPPLARKVKRRKWDLKMLPEHLTVVETDFALKYRCLKCGCMNAAQSRSSFFAKHWECSGEAVLRTTNRHFVRKALLPENRGRKPTAEEVLDPAWYQTYGVLPTCIAQPVSGGLIHCTVCAVKDRQCNRKKFITKHLECLNEPIFWADDGTYTFLDGVLQRSQEAQVPSDF